MTLSNAAYFCILLQTAAENAAPDVIATYGEPHAKRQYQLTLDLILDETNSLELQGAVWAIYDDLHNAPTAVQALIERITLEGV